MDDEKPVITLVYEIRVQAADEQEAAQIVRDNIFRDDDEIEIECGVRLVNSRIEE
jgi:hypothetical protein